MKDIDQLEQFIKLLSTSGLAEERIDFWINKVRTDTFTEKDEGLFADELGEQLNRVEEAIAVTEDQLDEARANMAAQEAKALPFLRDLAQHQPAVDEKNLKAYKSELEAGDKKFMGQLEQIRTKSGSEEMDAIRKKLGLS